MKVIPMKIAASRRTITVVAGVLISLAFIGYSVLHLDWSTFASSLAAVEPMWMAVFILTLLLTMVLRAWRWHMITGLPPRDWLPVWQAACIGYAGTAIFPARAGEVMRVIHLQRLAKASTGLAVGSSIVDRLIDAVALCVLIGAGLAIFVSTQVIEHRFVLMTGLLLLACTAVAIFVLGGHRWLRLPERPDRQGGIRSHVARWLGEAASGLQTLRSWRMIAVLAGLQCVISSLDILACWILIWAFGWTLPLAAALLTLICLAVVSALPSTPGYLGVYQVAAMAALHEFGLARSEALAYGTLLQVCNFGLFLAVGLWAYLKARL